MALLAIITDPITMFITHRNKGTYEPEYRLLNSVIGLVTGAGLFGFGAVVENPGSPYVAAILHGLVIFGVMALVVATSTYALDAYRDMYIEIFIVGMLVKNFLLYGFTYFINNWLATTGPRHVFFIFGTMGLGVMAGLPLCMSLGSSIGVFGGGII